MPRCRKIDNATLSGKGRIVRVGTFTMLFGGLLMMLAGLLGMVTLDVSSSDTGDGDDQSQIS